MHNIASWIFAHSILENINPNAWQFHILARFGVIIENRNFTVRFWHSMPQYCRQWHCTCTHGVHSHKCSRHTHSSERAPLCFILHIANANTNCHAIELTLILSFSLLLALELFFYLIVLSIPVVVGAVVSRISTRAAKLHGICMCVHWKLRLFGFFRSFFL